jgi:uncharacterized protein (TIGR00369 family)
MTQPSLHPGWVLTTDGEFSGWYSWPGDNWETHGGPFYMRREADGSITCAFTAQAKQMNGQNHMHGGAMMTFADFSLFAFASDQLKDSSAVTATMNSEFVSGAVVGDRVEARGEVVKAGRNLIFMRGTMTNAGPDAPKVMMTYSATLMRIARKT